MSSSLQNRQDELKDLIEGSPTLLSENKELLLQKINTLDKNKLDELITIFLSEKQKITEMGEKYSTQEASIQQQYIETVHLMEQKGIQKNLEYEKNEEEEKNKEALENIDQEMDSLQKEKIKNSPLESKEAKNKNFQKVIILTIAVILLMITIRYFFTR